MSEYKIVNNYLVFQELDSDSIGINHRAGEIEEKQATKHFLMTEVYPFLSGNPDTWKRIKILMEGIKKSNIPNLYSPDKILKGEDRAILVYPYLKGKTFERVLEDSEKKSMPLNFDLTFSIAIAIADLIDIGSSIVVSGEKSFHGFLTPDNIIIDYDGKILLKNYGIFPYLTKNEEIFNELVNKYGAWMTPELLRKEKPVPQSDVYHLGYMIYRVLTGEYFSYSEGEDFDAKFANISFTQHIPSSDKDFITNIINFFKKTLHPDPAQRFANMKAFKDYIANNFHIEELSSVMFNLAYFMNSLYSETMEAENKEYQTELAYVIPEPEEKPAEDTMGAAKDSGHLAEEILAGLDERQGAKSKLIIPIAAVFIILLIAGFFYIQQTKKEAAMEQEKIRQQTEARLAKLLKDQQAKQQEIEAKLKSLETEKTTSADEQKKKEEKMGKLMEELRETKDKIKEQQVKQEEEAAQKKKEEEAIKLKEKEDADRKLKEEEDKRKKEELRKKILAEKNKVQLGDEVPLMEVTEKPVRLIGKEPKLPSSIRRKYAANQKVTIRTMILVDENGDVTQYKVIGRTPPAIESVVTKALMKWKYKPATKNKVRVKVWLQVPITYEF